MLTVQALPQLLNNFSLVRKLSTGGNSDVWLAQDAEGNTFAAKIPHEGVEAMVVSEINIMAGISGTPNISPFITFYGAYNHLGVPVMVTEYFSGMRLCDTKFIMSEEQTKSIAREIYRALDYLHSRGISHGDVGCHNIMVSDTSVKVYDISDYVLDIPRDWKDAAYLSDLFVTTNEVWNHIYHSGDIDPLVLKFSRDIYEAGMTLRFLLGHSEPTHAEFIADPKSFRVALKDKSLEDVINFSIDIDPLNRITAVSALDFLSP